MLDGGQAKYEPAREEKDISKDYKGPDKFEGLGDLLDGVDKLVSKNNLADNYKQSGGQ